MKQIVLSIISLLSLSFASANNDRNIALSVYVLNDTKELAVEVESFLHNRLEKILTADGFVGNILINRFALVAKCDVIEKNIIATTPIRITQKIEVSLYVIDILENKVFNSCNLFVVGIGTNEVKSSISAFQKISINDIGIKKMLTDARLNIIDYYMNSCQEIITSAKTHASINEYDKAIFMLISVPNIGSDCFNRCQEEVKEIYQQKINTECNLILQQAKIKWLANPIGQTAMEIADMICKIDPKSDNYKYVSEFINSVSSKLTEDYKREWNYKMKQYNDDIQLKVSIINACKSIGETFAKNYKINNYILL